MKAGQSSHHKEEANGAQSGRATKNVKSAASFNAAHFAATGRRNDFHSCTSTTSAVRPLQQEQKEAFEPLIGSAQAASLLGDIHVKTLQRYARAGSIPGYQIGGHWYFRESELDSWLRSRINSSCHPCRSNGEAK
jgi:excisionase family DNA binding protein